MNDLWIPLMVCLTFGAGWALGFLAGVWKAAKMQALREQVAEHRAQVESDIQRGTRIVDIQPTKPWPRK